MMERTIMQIVADGILDDGAREYLSENLANEDSVDAYASNGCEIYLTRTECQKVLKACRKYLKSKCPDRELTLINSLA